MHMESKSGICFIFLTISAFEYLLKKHLKLFQHFLKKVFYVMIIFVTLYVSYILETHYVQDFSKYVPSVTSSYLLFRLDPL